MHIMSTNVAKTLVWKHEYDVKLRRHKHRTPQTNDHYMPLNETPHEIFCVRLWSRLYRTLLPENYYERHASLESDYDSCQKPNLVWQFQLHVS